MKSYNVLFLKKKFLSNFEHLHSHDTSAFSLKSILTFSATYNAMHKAGKCFPRKQMLDKAADLPLGKNVKSLTCRDQDDQPKIRMIKVFLFFRREKADPGHILATGTNGINVTFVRVENMKIFLDIVNEFLHEK